MRTTMILKDSIVKRAMELTDIKEKTALVHAGLEALINEASRKRLIALGGSDKTASVARRRKNT